MVTENISTLKIHRLTQEQYDRELAAGGLDEYALYLTPDDDINSTVKPDWNQNDENAADYINNRTHYEKIIEENILVDNLSSEDYNNEVTPQCTFTVGNTYKVILNDVVYDNIICTLQDGCKVIGGTADYPFYIDDDCGDNLYIECDDDIYTISIIEKVVELKQLDEKFIPNSIARVADMLGTSGDGYNSVIFNDCENNKAYGDYSHAEGHGTTADGGSSHAEGSKTTAAGGSSHAEGTESEASGGSSHAEGYGTKASGDSSHTEGTYTKALGGSSHAEGYGTEAIDYTSHAEGSYTIAYGPQSHAEGAYTTAFGDNSHAEGESLNKVLDILPDLSRNTTYKQIKNAWDSSKYSKFSVAFGRKSHIEGNNTIAFGENSHAEGENTATAAMNAHAEGTSTVASGYTSHAEGLNAIASGYGSHVEGRDTIAASEYQHVQGKYNTEDANNKYAHIVGNGQNQNNRSNAHTLDWNGNAWFAGDVYVGGSSQYDGKKLATEEYVDNSITNLVDSAPEAMNTLGELATAMKENSDVVDALDQAITNKAKVEHTHTLGELEGNHFVPKEIVVFEDTFKTDEEMPGSIDFSEPEFNLELGKNYKVVFNDAEYLYTATAFEDTDVLLNNNGLSEDDPISIFVHNKTEDDEWYAVITYYDESLAEFALAIYEISDTYYDIDEKFIPDTIARTEYVDDNFVRKSDLDTITNKSSSMKEITQDAYDALSEEEKNNGTMYLISDAAEVCEAGQIAYNNTISGLSSTNVQSAIDEISGNMKESAEYAGCFYREVNGEVEWINPPMEDKVVYKTTKRFFGKPVYVQCGTIGTLPNAATMTVATGNEGDVFDRVLQLEIEAIKESDGRRYRVPFFNASGELLATYYFAGVRTFSIRCSGDLSAYTGYYYLEFTKK